MARLQARQNRILRTTTVGAMIISIVVAVGACGGDATPPPPAPAQRQPPPAPVVTSPLKEERGGPVAYQSRGRRDPFRPSRVVIAETPPTVHLVVTGIVRGAQSFYAVVESDVSPGMGYIIREHDVVDSAKVVKITKDSVVFEVQTKNSEGKLMARYVEKHMPAGPSR